MANFRVTFARSARRELEALSPEVATRVLSRIEGLIQSPRPRGCRKIRGARNLYRIRVGSYRVVYTVDDSSAVVDVVAVRHRSDAYR